jgi:hypothetical protein
MREADISPPSSVEIKNEWNYTSTSPYALFEETLVDMSNQLPRGRRLYYTKDVWQDVLQKRSGCRTKRSIRRNF